MRIETLINLRNALRLAEADIGLRGLSASEKEFFFDIMEITNENSAFTSEKLRNSAYTSTLPHATYHRLLKRLMEKGIIARAPGRERNHYVVTVGLTE